MSKNFLPKVAPGLSPAEEVRQMGLQVGDTIVGREAWPSGWGESRLTLLWFGTEVAVWSVQTRSSSRPDWRDVGERADWILHTRRRWRKS